MADQLSHGDTHSIFHHLAKRVKLPDMPEARFGCKAFMMKEEIGKREILVVGGSRRRGISKTVFLYTEESNSWQTCSYELNIVRRVGAVGAKVGSKVYIFGGCDNTEWASFEVIDWDDPPTSRRWRQFDCIDRKNYEVVAVGTLIYVYVMGGSRLPRWPTTNRVDIFDTSTKIWSEGPPLQAPRRYFAAFQHGEASIVVAGGMDVEALRVCTVEKLDLDGCRDLRWRTMDGNLERRTRQGFPGHYLLMSARGSAVVASYDSAQATEIWHSETDEEWRPVPRQFVLRDTTLRFAAFLMASDDDEELWSFGGQTTCDVEPHVKSEVDCLMSPYRVFQHQLERIKAEKKYVQDNTMPVGLWPHLLSRVGKQHLESLMYYFVQQKCDDILPLGKKGRSLPCNEI